MAGPPNQEPKPAGCGCRWLWHIVVFLVLVFLLWLQRDNIPSAISDLRSQIAPLIASVVVNTAPAATSPPSPTAVQSPVRVVTAARTPTTVPFSEPTKTTSPTRGAASSILHDYKHGRWLEREDPGLATEIRKRGWIRDGIDEAESKAIQGIIYVAVGSRPLASSLLSRRWVRDGIDGAEADLIEHFAYVVREDAAVASQILDMLFLKTIEPPDVPAMESLSRLAVSDPQIFYGVLSHPTLSAGISNDFAPIVATLHGVAETNPVLIDTLLNPSNVVLEPRTITLPLSGEVVLTIIRTGPGAARSLDLLEHAVRSAEQYMGAPLPTNYVGLLFENAVPGSFAGTNFRTHITILPGYDVDDGSRDAAFAGEVIAHEVAHYYWAGNANWIDEGAADFMAAVIGSARTGRPTEVGNPPCAYAGNIAELEFLGIDRGDVEFECNYSLGQRLFVDLHRTLGAEKFRQGFRQLYLTSKVDHDTDDFPGTSLGIGHVNEAFRTDGGAANIVIARWYDGTEPYDLSHVDRDPIDPSLPGINGRIEEAFLTAGEDGPPVLRFPAQGLSDWIILTIEYSYSISGGPYEVPVEIVEYHQDGFAYHRRSNDFTAEAEYIGGTMWFSVGVPPSQQWAPGHYAVFVYAGGRKVAEVYYEVTP